MFLNKFIILQILNILTQKVVKTENPVFKGNYKTLQNGAIYLNKEHPLWILQDQKDVKLKQNNLFQNYNKYENFKSHKEISSKSFKKQRKLKTKIKKRLNKKGVQLPYNYIPFKNERKSVLATRKYRNSKFIQNMPVFDAVPGEESFAKSTPIFIYSGNKGRMLLNTMLSRDKYPMQEPVPGQVLRPPKSLVFKPKPLVEHLQRKLNVTMIPFYAYEAITPTTTTALYQPAKKYSYKKAKQYTAFFSPEEVLSQPNRDLTQYHYDAEYTTFSPYTLEQPYANHRFENTPSTTTTSMPHKKFEVTYNDGEDKFQITYEDDNKPLERPLNIPTTRFTTTQSPLTYESYTFDNNYYAFPVYTMSKLLENSDTKEKDDNVSIEEQRIEEIIDKALKEENDNSINSTKNEEDTWFILNSRYKGPLKKAHSNNIHSSKYIQTSLAKDVDKSTKLSLQPQKRSLS